MKPAGYRPPRRSPAACVRAASRTKAAAAPRRPLLCLLSFVGLFVASAPPSPSRPRSALHGLRLPRRSPRRLLPLAPRGRREVPARPARRLDRRRDPLRRVRLGPLAAARRRARHPQLHGRRGPGPVPRLELGRLRRRRRRRRGQGPLLDPRLGLRHRPPAARRRRPGGLARRDLRLQPRLVVRRRGPRQSGEPPPRRDLHPRRRPPRPDRRPHASPGSNTSPGGSNRAACTTAGAAATPPNPAPRPAPTAGAPRANRSSAPPKTASTARARSAGSSSSPATPTPARWSPNELGAALPLRPRPRR